MEKIITTYVLLIKRGKMTLEEVPSELREEVVARLEE